MASNTIIIATVALGVVSASIIDLKTRRVPNALTVTLAVIGLGIAATGVSEITLATSVVGFALGLVLMLPGYIFGATGAGDVKLFAALGALMGPLNIANAFIYTAIAGGVIAVIVAVKRGLFRQTVKRVTAITGARAADVSDATSGRANNRFAYAPAIAVGAMLAAFGL